MTMEINVNVKIEGMSELIKAIENVAKITRHVPVDVKEPIKVTERKEVKDVTTISDAEAVSNDAFDDFVKESKVKETKTKPTKVKEKLAADEFFATPTEEPKEQEKPNDPVKEITIEDLRTLGCKISQAGKTQDILALLKEYGIKKMTEVPEDKRAEFFSKAEKLVA